MLNWRRDPDYEQRRIQHELTMTQLESEIEQIEKETEQLRRENAKQKALSALIEQHCFPDDFNSIPRPPTEPGSTSS